MHGSGKQSWGLDSVSSAYKLCDVSKLLNPSVLLFLLFRNGNHEFLGGSTG